MLEQIEAELADGRVSTLGKWRLHQRAGLVRGLLTVGLSPPRRDLDRSLRLGSRSSGVGDLAGGGGVGASG
jgi:hypothetical protein